MNIAGLCTSLSYWVITIIIVLMALVLLTSPCSFHSPLSLQTYDYLRDNTNLTY